MTWGPHCNAHGWREPSRTCSLRRTRASRSPQSRHSRLSLSSEDPRQLLSIPCHLHDPASPRKRLNLELNLMCLHVHMYARTHTHRHKDTHARAKTFMMHVDRHTRTHVHAHTH